MHDPREAAALLMPILIVTLTVVAMEGVAYLVHKYVMHGFGWGWHRSHHEKRTGVIEKNDRYAVLFGAFSLFFFWIAASTWPPLWWVGVGMAVYGLLYTLLHDAMVHRRIPFIPPPRSGYLKRLVQAHRLHHAVAEREGAVSFGFLYAPPVHRLRQELKQQGGRT